MTLPNFLIIGAAKSGTTALYTYIKQHPDIYMSTPKELRYFSYTGPYPAGLSKKYIHEGITNLEDYKNQFNSVNDEKIIGEASPMYLYTSGTAERIKAIIPNVKMLSILRNPVDRAFSSYTHALRDWNETANSFQEALEKEPERIKAGWGILWHYTQAGFYFEQLSRYYRVFNRDQLKVVLYEDLVNDPLKLCKDIFKYLNVTEHFKPDTSNHPNVSGFPKNQKFHKFMEKLFMYNNPIKSISRLILPKSFRNSFKEKMVFANLEKRKMPEQTRKQLQDLFREDIHNLEELIQRDLSHWLEK